MQMSQSGSYRRSWVEELFKRVMGKLMAWGRAERVCVVAMEGCAPPKLSPTRLTHHHQWGSSRGPNRSAMRGGRRSGRGGRRSNARCRSTSRSDEAQGSFFFKIVTSRGSGSGVLLAVILNSGRNSLVVVLKLWNECATDAGWLTAVASWSFLSGFELLRAWFCYFLCYYYFSFCLII